MAGFKEIIGQDLVKEYFQSMIGSGSISHAYIITGEKGSGRSMLAKAFAMTLLCEERGEEACGQCHSCRQFLTDSHPDVVYVTHEKPGSIGVDEVREQIVNTVSIRPYSSAYKIYIVPDAQKMTVQAQNALLKTIEEPPAYAVILLLAEDEQGFLPTILSRCMVVKVKPLEDSQIRDYLAEKRGMDPARAGMFSVFARGNLGRALELADSPDFMELYERTVRLLKVVEEKPTSVLAAELREMQDRIAEVLGMMKLWYRDIMVFKASQNMNLLVFRQEERAIYQAARSCSFQKLDRVMTAIDKAVARLNANVSFDTAMELLLLTMKENRE